MSPPQVRAVQPPGISASEATPPGADAQGPTGTLHRDVGVQAGPTLPRPAQAQPTTGGQRRRSREEPLTAWGQRGVPVDVKVLPPRSTCTESHERARPVLGLPHVLG